MSAPPDATTEPTGSSAGAPVDPAAETRWRLPRWAWLIVVLVVVAVLAFIPGGVKEQFSVAQEFDQIPSASYQSTRMRTGAALQAHFSLALSSTDTGVPQVRQ